MKQKYSVSIYLDSSSRTSNPCISKKLSAISWTEAVKELNEIVDFYKRYLETGWITLYDSFGESFTMYF